MIVGYTMKDNTIYCASCWRTRQTEGPDRILHAESLEEPEDSFWLVNFCKGCGVEVKYREARFLG